MKSPNVEYQRDADENRDPITGTPGAHPVGTGLGAAGGGAAGAALGSAAGAALGAAGGAALGSAGGPIGAAVGLVAGAIAGGLGGKGIAEQIDPTVEDAYWRKHYAKQSYVDRGAPYDTYAPAYRTGYEGRHQYAGKRFDEVEEDLRRDYAKSGGSAALGWDKAKHAVRDAWGRVENALPGNGSRNIR